MKTFLSFLILATLSADLCSAQITFTTTPFAATNSITHSGARILSATNQLTISYVVWGTTPSSTCSGSDLTTTPPCPTNYPKYETTGTFHGVNNWFIGGAPANTLIPFRVCASTTGAQPWTCSAEQTFTTSVAPNPYAAVAALPITTPAPVLPTPGNGLSLSGTTWYVGSSAPGGMTACGTFLACWTSASCGDTIVVPSAGTIYSDFSVNSNPVTLPAKSCSSSAEILITNDQPTELPPTGVRIDPTYESVLGSIQSSDFSHYPDYPTETLPNNLVCYPGTYLWPLD